MLTWAPGPPLGAGAWSPSPEATLPLPGMNRKVNREKGSAKAVCRMEPSPVKIKAEIEVILPQAKECQRLSANHKELAERMGHTLSHSPQKEL